MELYQKSEILHKETVGRVHTVIAKGESEAIKEAFLSYNPLLCDVIPLSLEEVFIYEMEAVGYDSKNILG